MMALCPEAVDMSKFSTKEWYVRGALEASAELGRFGRDLILAHVRSVLGIKTL
jgi:creatinine amidohydrolase